MAFQKDKDNHKSVCPVSHYGEVVGAAQGEGLVLDHKNCIVSLDPRAPGALHPRYSEIVAVTATTV
jgi:hypothetical protein